LKRLINGAKQDPAMRDTAEKEKSKEDTPELTFEIGFLQTASWQ
jgi:hypothetical protein